MSLTTILVRGIMAALFASLSMASMAVDATQTHRTTRETPLVLRFGALGSGSEHDFLSYPIRAFIAEVKEKTGGMVEFQYFSAGQLGGEPEMFDQILSGSLDASALSANVLATAWPQLYAYNLPFAFRDIEEFWHIAGGNSAFASALREAVNRSDDAHLVATFSSNFRGLQNTKRPVRSPADLKGLTLRVMTGDIFTDIFHALGANTAAVPFGQLHTSLQQGNIDGEDLVPSMIYDVGLFEVEKYSTQIRMTPSVNALVISTDAWNRLSDSERRIIETAAFNAEKISKKIMLDFETEYTNRLEQLGIDVIRYHDLTDEERDAFIDATKGIWNKYRPVIGLHIYDAYLRSKESPPRP